ncbi:hypothetical protein AVEN_12652-1 [Araneus ventricosus]|uniref:Uncharacterized protein n=1 Tax=Araneus ventricosus TaxID=182803 RepID=A0A4Y2ABB2_ARAVE|nr:hypothetical protein AVEN_12652-1 [Araneus ventricosus]
MTGARYLDKILDPYVRPYTGPIGDGSMLLDDKARPRRVICIIEYLDKQSFEIMYRPARKLGFNTNQHLWDDLGRQLAVQSSHPGIFHELEEGLLRVRSFLKSYDKEFHFCHGNAISRVDVCSRTIYPSLTS